ncbi:MarR family winged helix-turn-helix transcriptional regulator [Actinoplanes sp. N902-109]|uniref:MarR family winged helix-turn-helix transcriptional regulator n=1 Tax=Actinoplanes sp. (strain N902-109) TaxID=649831 RepID=UPI00032939E5|nr:MarR family transcriptional regulator [Actinoplanes sp. N902-109]AGL14888.1 regulatory protein marr [Actinoplanes sp. N902-109]
MAEHHGPDGPQLAAAVDDAAASLLGVWDAAREQATPRLSGSQLGALLVVERTEGINLRGLAGELRMILSSASRLCDRLVASGLVDRVPGRADRREIALYLTPSARALLDNLRTTRRQILGEVLDRMGPAGRAALVRGLTEFQAAATAADRSDMRTA